LKEKKKFDILRTVQRDSLIHLVVCLTTGPKPLPKRALHIVRSRASSFKQEYPLLSLRSSSSFLHLLPRLPVTSIPHFIFPSITRCRRQFLHKMWPIQLAYRFLISCRIFLCSLTLSNTSSFLTWSVQLIFSILLQHHISKALWYFHIIKANKMHYFSSLFLYTTLDVSDRLTVHHQESWYCIHSNWYLSYCLC